MRPATPPPEIDQRDESRRADPLRGAVPLGGSPITEQSLRREVPRDLEALMDAVALESSEDLTEFGLACENRC